MNKIYLGNLSFKVTEQELQQQFEQYGTITEIALIQDRFTKKLKGFGFITFENSQAAQKALEMDGKEFLGRPLKVNIANERRESNGDSGRRGDRW